MSAESHPQLRSRALWERGCDCLRHMKPGGGEDMPEAVVRRWKVWDAAGPWDD